MYKIIVFCDKKVMNLKMIMMKMSGFQQYFNFTFADYMKYQEKVFSTSILQMT